MTVSNLVSKAESLEAVSDSFDIEPSGEQPEIPFGLMKGGIWKVTDAFGKDFGSPEESGPFMESEFTDWVGEVLKEHFVDLRRGTSLTSIAISGFSGRGGGIRIGSSVQFKSASS